MARYRITAPVPHVSGTIAGVPFVESIGETDLTRATVYFRRHGYKVEDLGEQAELDPAAAGDTAPGPDQTRGTPPPVAKPAKSASKADWVTHAVTHGGMTKEDAEALTRDALAERFTDPTGGTQ